MRTTKIILCSVISLSASCEYSLLGDCEDQVKQEAISPDGKKVTTVFERDCGATTDYSTIVSLRSITEEFGISNRRILVLKGKRAVQAEWVSGSALLLNCQACEKEAVLIQDDRWEDVEIKLKY